MSIMSGSLYQELSKVLNLPINATKIVITLQVDRIVTVDAHYMLATVGEGGEKAVVDVIRKYELHEKTGLAARETIA